MREHVKADEPFEREEVSAGDALERFVREGQDYKVELIEDLVRDEGVDTVSLYTNGPFTDLCRGPHSPSTGHVGAFKLQSVAGAYWRGNADNPMLTRIYGTAFPTKKELEEHLERLEQARARDHRKIGQELELFMFSPLSPGSPFWQPNGMAVWNALAGLWREQNSAPRLPRGQDADPLRRRAVEAVRPLGQVTASTCTSPRSRTARWASSR